jgi:hypothetical protein
VKRISLLLALLGAFCATVASAASDPTVTISPPTEVSGAGDQFYSAGTVWFRPTGSGSFTLNAKGSGVDEVTFPDISDVSGWSGSTGGKDTSSPYSSPVAYSWTAGAAAPGKQTVTGKTSTDEKIDASVTISADSTGPIGQTITLNGGPFFAATSVPLTLARGTDVGAGLAPSGDVVERASASLQNGNCGAYGAFTAVALVNGSDTSVTTGSCYRWQLKVMDNVGNVSAASPATADAKVDTTPPTLPSLFFTGLVNAGAVGSIVYYRPSAPVTFTLGAAAADPESGVASYSFPSIPGSTEVRSGPIKTWAFTSLSSPPSAPLTVTATNRAGVTSAAASFTLLPDTSPPAVTAYCNGQPCKAAPYSEPVLLTFTGADAGSGLSTIRYTTDGTTPTTDNGYQYVSGVVVRSLTHLQVRAYDKAGNGSNPLSLTIRPLITRLVFGAPARLTVPARDHYLKARLTSTQRASVVAVMSGRGLAHPQRWQFVLQGGTWLVQLKLPVKIERGRVYNVRWTLSTGSRRATRLTHVTLR